MDPTLTTSAHGVVFIGFSVHATRHPGPALSKYLLLHDQLFWPAPPWHITLALGALAAVVGSMDIMSWFIPFLLFLGIATPPVAGIYIADYLLYRRQGYDHAVLQRDARVKLPTFAAWLAGSLVGFATVNGVFSLTSIPSLDSIAVACLCYMLLSRLSTAKQSAGAV